MNTRSGIAVGLALLSALGVGAASLGRLHAQARTPAFVVIDISETMDADAYIKAVSAAEPNATQSAGGRFIVRTNSAVALDGPPPNRFIIVAFDDAEKAKAWYGSPAIKEVNATRLKVTKSRAFVVEGLAK
jgi:uncharacterized protein (DUF1330 family)